MTIPDLSLAGKVAIVTGARKGIGRGIASAFAEAGADVAVCDRNIEDSQLEDLAAGIRKLGRRSLAIQADTSCKAEVDNFVQKVMEKFGTIDILVNNAAIILRAPMLDMTEADFDRLVGINLKGYLLCAQAAGRVMVKQKRGVIINISTQHAFRSPEASANMGAYAVVKAGVVMLTRVLARELGKSGIRVNSVAPGLVKTDFSKHSWSNPEFLKEREANLPLGRVAEVDDIIGAVLFLASDASSYITGNTILADGGGLA